MINVTKTFLPPQAEYFAILERVWSNAWITNRGPLVQELESVLQQRLTSRELVLMANGTLPLQIAIKSLDLKGEIITTPFSYIATTSSILWEGCCPVFVDIDPNYLTINENLIEAAITTKTTAILATHVYGNPCHVESISKLSKKYNLKVIYDAAHCFGVEYKGQSIFNYGDISTCSFHATKLFHTGEGGGLFCSKDLRKNIFDRHNFGHDKPGTFSRIGINAKMSELQAALGLAVLPYLGELVWARKQRVEVYNQALKKGRRLSIRASTKWNYSYYPLILESEEMVKQLIDIAIAEGINLRRYFYPSLNMLPFVDYKAMPQAERIAKTVVCLPLYHDLALKDQYKVIEIINNL
ncbi:aminotransferase DegT [Gilvibacter sp. SZ-19]|uniref:DegT/DnrJ/EryC1/StrS family aminotransferase n=1 Tax=Gilvibacter sp. SZ-19 TaxID=754429 RepID=UPI000B3D2B27|nr:DegT/DnrJ/EryC1/StrS family aminotransferase [Gilvibacter sp. SZ-19]ARV12796.1 aminotransferase DegT [Gilvibacter sp. SZ-19]